MKTIIFSILAVLFSVGVVTLASSYSNHIEADLEQDYGGELPEGELITVRFLYNDFLMYEAVATEEELDYTVTVISEQMQGKLLFSEATEDLITYYYGDDE